MLIYNQLIKNNIKEQKKNKNILNSKIKLKLHLLDNK
jgi:hypothetical protein